MNNARLTATVAAALFLFACEKPAGPTGAAAPAPPVAAAPEPLVASALPALPALPDPTFGPDFVDRAGGTNLFEIAEAKLALTRSNRAEVKAFASAMIAAHTKSTAALQAAINASGQTIEAPTVLPDDFQAKFSALSRTAAADFDRAYLADQVAAHQAALSTLQTYARRGDTAALKKFAADAAPVVEDHLAHAQALQAAPR